MPANLRRSLTALGVAVFWLGLWTLASFVANRSLLVPVPYPWGVAATLWGLLGEGSFWATVAYSLVRILAGFLLAVLVGGLLAVLTVRFSLAHTLLAPVLSLVRAGPVASFIFLAFLWIRAGFLPSFIAFLMVVPLVWENIRQGLIQTDRRLLEMAAVFRLSRCARLRRVWAPSVRPYAQAALTTGFGFAWKSGVAAEVICLPPDSIGAQIAAAKSYINTEEVFAWTAVVVVLSVLLERCLRRLMHRGEQG